jgi:hypothetical protein
VAEWEGFELVGAPGGEQVKADGCVATTTEAGSTIEPVLNLSLT